MKSALTLGLFLAASPAFAGDNSRQIYDALGTQAVSVEYRNSAGYIQTGGATWEKTVGGLICRKTGAVASNPTETYSCYLGIEPTEMDSEAIYHALNVPPTQVRNGGMKKVGTLTCVVAANDTSRGPRTFSHCELDRP